MKELSGFLTAIIKTFERPRHLDRLIKSIRAYYPELRVLVADDSKDPVIRDDVEYFVLPYDVGLSYGRNFLVNKVKTKYTLLLDDDHTFTEDTKLEKMVEVLEENPIDLVGGDFIEQGRYRREYHGIYKISFGVLFHYMGKNKGYLNGYPLYDYTHNFFVARTEKLKESPWDEKIKFNTEHEDFFLRARNVMNITRLPEFSLNHFSVRKYYCDDRGDVQLDRFKSKWNIIGRTASREPVKGGFFHELKAALHLRLFLLSKELPLIKEIRSIIINTLGVVVVLLKQKEFVFIVSCQRSGATPLKELLCEAGDVASFPEVRLKKKQQFEKAYSFFRTQRERIVLIKYPCPLERGLYDEHVDCGIRLKGKFIALYRDPYQTLRSFQKMTEHISESEARTNEELIDYWCSVYETLIDLKSKIGREKIVFFNYEELCNDPKAVTRQLFRFIGSNRKEGFDSYQGPKKYFWQWGMGDNSDKLWGLKIQKPETHENDCDPELLREIEKSKRVQSVWEELQRESRGNFKTLRS